MPMTKPFELRKDDRFAAKIRRNYFLRLFLYRNGFSKVIVKIHFWGSSGPTVINLSQSSANSIFCSTLSRLTKNRVIVYLGNMHASS